MFRFRRDLTGLDMLNLPVFDTAILSARFRHRKRKERLQQALKLHIPSSASDRDREDDDGGGSDIGSSINIGNSTRSNISRSSIGSSRSCSSGRSSSQPRPAGQTPLHMHGFPPGGYRFTTCAAAQSPIEPTGPEPAALAGAVAGGGERTRHRQSERAYWIDLLQHSGNLGDRDYIHDYTHHAGKALPLPRRQRCCAGHYRRRPATPEIAKDICSCSLDGGVVGERQQQQLLLLPEQQLAAISPLGGLVRCPGGWLDCDACRPRRASPPPLLFLPLLLHSLASEPATHAGWRPVPGQDKDKDGAPGEGWDALATTGTILTFLAGLRALLCVWRGLEAVLVSMLGWVAADE